MINSWIILAIGLGYLGLLFAAATWGDRLALRRAAGAPRPFIYALSLSVYCTSWTYFGSVGIASRAGFDFLPIYIGPILVFALGWKMLQAIAAIAKRQNIASIADFIATRYGKSEGLGALVAAIAVIGIVPYISIQLKAVAASLHTIAPASLGGADPAILIALTMAAFAILFGTRHIDTTEHQDGMIFAIAIESVVKLVAFVSVGLFITIAMAGGFAAVTREITSGAATAALFSKDLDGGRWLTLTLLAAIAIILLPRQFHVGVVENAHPSDIRRAAWLFPLYLVVINLFVVPIAVAGLLLLPPGTDGDTFVLALPVSAGNTLFALIAFIGGLSASTAMVIVETIALSIMVCNNLVVPVLLRRHDERAAVHGDMGAKLIAIRRAAIGLILALAYGYYVMIGSTAALAQVGLISFAAIAQLAPAFFGGLIWRRGTARGAMAGISAGFAVWAYTLLLPSFSDAGWISHSFIEQGPLGLGALKPRMLFYMEFDPLTHGVLWSLAANLAAYTGFSLTRAPTPIERIQAQGFIAHEFQPTAGAGFRLWRTAITVAKLEETVARYLGKERARVAFSEFLAQRDVKPNPAQEADVRMLRFAEHLLASAIGNASSRLVIALMLERHTTHAPGAMKLLDDASAAIQYNRDLLQSAIDNVSQGIGVFDPEMTLVCWNNQFEKLLRLGPELARVGAPLPEIAGGLRRNLATGAVSQEVLVKMLAEPFSVFRQRMAGDGQVLEIRSSAMPDGGMVATVTDQTEAVGAADVLQRLNESLERRVEERTAELTRLNAALAAAKAEAEAANIGKTRFIAAASHDILQPLNAARLFTASLVERHRRSEDAKLVRNVDASLEAVEEIISALLDISKLDAGAHKPEVAPFRIDEILQALAEEFQPAACEKGLKLIIMPCGATIDGDRKLLRRVLQNLLANAIKYTAKGRVLMGCRRMGGRLRIEVHDTGPGIPREMQALVFQEFHRLDGNGADAPGLGLGLSIVERTAKLLGSAVTLRSEPGKGSMFAVDAPLSRAPVKPQARPAVLRSPGLGNVTSVLIIDNEPQILEGMRQLISGWGCAVHLAKSGAAALKAYDAAGGRIDMILADYHLARENGIAIIGKLRLKARAPLPAILITADASDQVQREAIAADVHYFRKPVKPAALRAAMAQLSIRAAAE